MVTKGKDYIHSVCGAGHWLVVWPGCLWAWDRWVLECKKRFSRSMFVFGNCSGEWCACVCRLVLGGEAGMGCD